MAADESYYRAGHRRIEFLTLGLGAAGTVIATLRWDLSAGAGVALGAALAWVNFRWLKQGVATIAQLATAQAGAVAVRIPKRVYSKFFGRLVLLLVVICVTLWRSMLPPAAIFVGLFALVAAVLAEMIYELARSIRTRDTGE